MSRYRRVLFSLPMIITAVLVLQRSSSSQTATGTNQALGENDICPDNGDHENICEDSRDCEDDDNGNRRCVSFSREIQAIFNNRCTNCHNPTLLRGMLDLTPGNSYTNLVNRPTSPGCVAEVPGSVRVVPCNPLASMLWRKTLPDNSRCRAPMPLNTPGLGVIAPGEFALIQAWICQGARNN